MDENNTKKYSYDKEIGVFAFEQVPDPPAIIGLVLITAGVLIINLFSKKQTR